MNKNIEIVQEFYKAFQRKDAKAMGGFYNDKVKFEDPAFGPLEGQDVSDMWEMLCERSTDLTINFDIIEETGDWVKTEWIADYTFTKTQRKVHNIVQANMRIENGKIIEHYDQFDLHRWAINAFGFKGALLGGTNFFKKKLQKQTKNFLKKYQEKNKN